MKQLAGYRYRTLRKRGGGARVIAAPIAELANRQREILATILEPAVAADVGEHAHGFVPGRSIATNAAPHAGRALVVKLDLRGFYPSVTERRVLGIFRRLGHAPRVARQLARLCTEPRTRALPQGAPTSPALSNLIARSLDRRLAALAARLGWAFTRYADDLTFSWPGIERDHFVEGARLPRADDRGRHVAGGADGVVSKVEGVPTRRTSHRGRSVSVGLDEGRPALFGALENLPPKDAHGESVAPRVDAVLVVELLAGVERVVRSEGFALATTKTSVQRSSARQTVTGVVVNETPSLPRADIRKLRAILHQAEHTGLAAQNREGIERWEEHLRGKLALLHMIHPEKAAPLVKAFEALVKP